MGLETFAENPLGVLPLPWRENLGVRDWFLTLCSEQYNVMEGAASAIVIFITNISPFKVMEKVWSDGKNSDSDMEKPITWSLSTPAI